MTAIHPWIGADVNTGDARETVRRVGRSSADLPHCSSRGHLPVAAKGLVDTVDYVGTMLGRDHESNQVKRSQCQSEIPRRPPPAIG